MSGFSETTHLDLISRARWRQVALLRRQRGSSIASFHFSIVDSSIQHSIGSR